ncbi:hypothetical protein BDB00DRAFT_759738 [Zychaea mexicana]|uniref:uncharacterized protein n=1 Tax=Zychaea mexicana TaxID=64656 RepID=UPI0022FEEE33|nr:uncharacterized protein BDB00DRAFT_759738 [Zychaea mexicana]KAI9495660.1 hypothetical protein BDB00DRAFT_759738 [Zychaea mexicana]
MGVFSEFTSLNFSLYAQWLGIISICLLIALGIVGFISHIVFSIVGWVIALILIFVEIPLCLKCCPTSPKFFAVVMFLSNILNTGPLIAAAVTLLLAAISYGIAAMKGQSFASSRLLGGTGVDNVKLASLRSEIDTANARAEEAQKKVDELESEHNQKDDNLNELQNRSKLLEEQLEKAEADLKEATSNFREADLRAEQLGKKAVKLDQEAKEWDKKNADLEAKHKGVKDELDEMERQLEGV